MRISLVTYDLSTLDSQTAHGSINALAHLIAHENISCVFLQGCRTDSFKLSDSDGPLPPRESPAAHLQYALRGVGLRYELVHSRVGETDGPEAGGCAVLSQVPVLESLSDPRICNRANACNAVMARLALGPNTVLDAYSASLGADAGARDEADRLLSFVDQTPALLQERRPAKPRKRGPVRQHRPADSERVESRVIVIGASVHAHRSDDLSPGFSDQNYGDLTRGIRLDNPTDGEKATRHDYLSIKPAVRPLEARLALYGADGRAPGEHSAVLVVIEL